MGIKHNRRSIRLRGYDYTQAGAYFVTVCVHNDLVRRGAACCAHQPVALNSTDIFGHIENGKMVINDYGRIVDASLRAIPDHFSSVILDEFTVMPNHVHLIVIINDARAQHAAPVLGTIVRSFKSAVTKNINKSRGTPGTKVWQRNYYERIIRNDGELNRIREYVVNNPANWDTDEHNPFS